MWVLRCLGNLLFLSYLCISLFSLRSTFLLFSFFSFLAAMPPHDHHTPHFRHQAPNPTSHCVSQFMIIEYIVFILISKGIPVRRRWRKSSHGSYGAPDVSLVELLKYNATTCLLTYITNVPGEQIPQPIRQKREVKTPHARRMANIKQSTRQPQWKIDTDGRRRKVMVVEHKSKSNK